MMFVTLIPAMLNRKYRYRCRGTHHSDAASCTSVTRLLVKDKIKVRGGGAAYGITIERIYAAGMLTTVSRHPCQCSSDGCVV